MLRRMLPTLIALAAGFLVLAWGLLRLQQVFRLERDEARRGVASRRATLARYAERTLAHELEAALRRARPEIERAQADPLAAADHLLFFDRGEQRLPRRFVPWPGESTPGRDLFDALRQGRVAEIRAAEIRLAAEPDSPWARRLVLYQRFAAAIDGHRGAEAASGDVASTFRAILAHRQRYLIRRDLDLPYMLALLDFFATESRPDPALLRALLHDGLSDGWGGQVRDLSRLLLESRERFTAADFEILSGRLAELAESAGIPYQAFLTRAREETGAALALDLVALGDRPSAGAGASGESGDSGEPDDAGTAWPGAPALVSAGSWYVEGGGPDAAAGHLNGVAVDFDAFLARIRDEMEQLGLIAAGDRVLADELPASRVAIGDLRLRVASPAWEQALGDVEARYSLKTGLIALSAIFALAVVTLATVLQHRRHRLLELKADFVATVSHELRTPLASVRLLGETLERRLAGHPPARDYPSRIVREIDGLSFLVENILSFNRLDKARWRMRGADVPLVELVDFLRTELELHVTRTVRLESDGLDGLTLRGDPELLKLLFLNLARNACQYNAREPVVIAITAAGAAGDRRRLRFRDNGWGLSQGETRKVFTEFYRSRTRGVKGTGLGLAICRRIMKLHDGEIRVAETSGEGTTFELVFGTWAAGT